MRVDSRSIRRWMPAALLSIAMLCGASAWAAEGGDEKKDIVLKGDAVCTRCHDEGEEKPVLSIGKTKHGTVADARTPTCTSCHGESPTHINKPEGVSERPSPDVNYVKNSKTPIEKRNETCLNCHSGSKRMFWSNSTHAQEDVACTSCHEVHTQHDKVRDKITQPETCFNCHKDKRAEIERPSRHPIKEGKVACSDCHNPHGSAGPKLMARDSVVATCHTCHADKRGPFLWSHQPVTEDCAICHNPHGTTTPKMLKERVPFLCQECHEPGSHQGFAPSLSPYPQNNGMPQPDVVVARGCMNCHTNIHGGSSPVNSSGARSLVK